MEEMKMKHLKLSISEQIATITLCYPPQNRMGLQMLSDFEEALNTVAYTEDVRVMVLRGEGGVFSYGGYFPEWIGVKSHDVRALIERWNKIISYLERLPFPVIASVDGACWGGGFEFALACDMILATPESTFNHPEKTISVTTMLGGVYRFAERAGKNIAAELAYTAKPLTAERMQQLGVVNRLIPKEDLEKETAALAGEIANGPAAVHVAHKSLLRLWSQSGKAAAEEALVDYSVLVIPTNDCQTALKAAKHALDTGTPRPALKFEDKCMFR